MNSSLSYGTKRRRMVNERLALQSSDDDNVLNTQIIATTSSISNSTVSSHINFDNNLNISQQILLNIPFNEQNLKDSTESIPIISCDFIKNINCTNKNKMLKTVLGSGLQIIIGIRQYALNALLNVLKCDGGLIFLPKDSHTLLQCKSKKVTNIRNVEPRGYYYNFGLSASIMKCSFQFPLTSII